MTILLIKFKINFTLQSEYADALPGLDLFFVSVYGDSHTMGGTKLGCDFLEQVGSFIPYSFIGYLSSKSGN